MNAFTYTTEKLSVELRRGKITRLLRWSALEFSTGGDFTSYKQHWEVTASKNVILNA